MKKLFEAFLILGGILTLTAPLMGCQPNTPALTAAEVQASQWREISNQQILLAEQQRKVVCLKVAAGDPIAMLAQLAYKYTCKSGE